MVFLVRKITRTKRLQGAELDKTECRDIPADAITIDLKTNNNALSVWWIASDTDLPEVVLALSSNMEHLNKIEVVYINEQDLLDQGMIVDSERNGLTAVTSLAQIHRDIAEMTWTTLGKFACAVLNALKNNQDRCYSRSAVKGILNEAILNGRLDKAALKPSMAQQFPSSEA